MGRYYQWSNMGGRNLKALIILAKSKLLRRDFAVLPATLLRLNFRRWAKYIFAFFTDVDNKRCAIVTNWRGNIFIQICKRSNL